MTFVQDFKQNRCYFVFILDDSWWYFRLELFELFSLLKRMNAKRRAIVDWKLMIKIVPLIKFKLREKRKN